MTKKQRHLCKWVKRTFAGLCVLIGLLVGVLWLLFRSSLPLLEGKIQLPEGGQPFVLERDAEGVPTLNADSHEAAMYALGFAHAQDRFFQMDTLRRTGAGELSELIGSFALEYDKYLRLHDGRALAERALRDAPASQRAVLEAYTHGVNTGLEALGSRPPEYFIFRQKPRPWEPVDSLLVGLAMFYDLQDTHGRLDQSMGALQTAFPELAEHLVTNGYAWDAPLDGSVAPIEAPPVEAWVLRLTQAAATEHTSFREQSKSDWWEKPPGSLGSNAFAANAPATANKRAIIAHDMHLGLRVPHIWYRTHLRFQDEGQPWQLDGVTLPGFPALITGTNGYLAWGFTNSYADLTDLVRLELHPEDQNQYKTQEGWETFVVREEQIPLPGNKVESYTIKETIWGPVLPEDPDEPSPTPHYAVQWAGKDKNAFNTNFVEFFQITSVTEAATESAVMGIPTQNLVMADAEGNIGWTHIGTLPLRQHHTGTFPLHFEQISNTSQTPPPSTQRPQVINPPSGMIWTANQRLVGGSDLQRVGDGGYDRDGRGSRIRELLKQSQSLNEAQMLAIQLDNYAPEFPRWRDLLLSCLAENGDHDWTELTVLLENYDGHADINSIAHRFVRGWRIRVIDALEEKLLGFVSDTDPLFRVSQLPLEETWYWLVYEQPEPLVPFFENDSWKAFLQAHAHEIYQSLTQEESRPLAEATWGEFNTLRMRHPLAMALPFLDPMLSMPAAPMAGDSWAVNVLRPGFGASQRTIISPGDMANAIHHQPGGPSGHFLSPFYRAGHKKWAEGTASPLLPGESVYRLEAR